MEEDIENTPSMEADNGQSFLEIELEALQAIYVHEVEVIHNEKSTSVSIDLHPATADKVDEQYVMMTLKFILDAEYPHNIPEIHIRNPRGLSDEKLNSIIQDLNSIAESKIGKEMLFEVIEAAKEHLTEDNRPCGKCAICLCSFSDDDVFTKTDCYHYFHSHCLARYSKTAVFKEVDHHDLASGEEEVPDKELLCPVCRLRIHFEGSEEDFPPPSLRDEEFVIGEDVLEIQKRMADLYQKQVVKGGIIDIEAEKNKYLLEISNVPTRTTDEAASSDNLSKEEENAIGDTQSLQNEDSKDSNPDSNSPSKNTISAEEKAKNEKKYNKQPRNKYPNRTNKRSDNYKPKYNKSDREGTQKDISSPRKTARNEEENSEDNCDEEDSVTKTSGARSDANSYRRNERKNNYGPPRRYYDDEYGRGNYYRYPDSRGGNRGRRFAPNGYDRRNFRDHGYRGRGSRSHPERETPVEQNHQNDPKSSNSAQDMAACKEIMDQNLPDSSKDDSKFERDNSSKNRQYPHKKYSDGAYNKRESYSKNKPDSRDGCPDRDSRKPKVDEEDEHEVKERDGNDRSYSDRFQAGSYRDRRHYSDIRLSYSERDAQSQRRGGYGTRDNSGRGSYGRNRNRGPYRNHIRRENSEEDAQIEEEKTKEEDDSKDGTEERGNRGSDNPKHQFSEQRSSYRGSRSNPRRNGNSYRQNTQHFNERRDGYSNGLEDSRDNRDSYPEGSSDVKIPLSHDRNDGGGDDDLAEESGSRRYSQRNPQEGYSRRYEDRRNYNPQRGGFRDSDNRDSYPEGGSDVQIPLSHDRNDGGRDDDLVEESGSRRYSQRNPQEGYSRRYEDRRNYNPQRGGFRDSDRNRPNSDFQNKSPNYRRNQRYSNERPYRNKSDSYQYKNNSSRKYNSDQYPDTSDSAVKQVDRGNSELHSAENSSEKTVAAEVPKPTKYLGSSNEKEPFLQESSQSKAHSSESPCKDVPPVQLPAAKPHATFSSSSSPKMLQPPPGFSNPLKKVVYGLQAANPPPGFPRS